MLIDLQFSPLCCLACSWVASFGILFAFSLQNLIDMQHCSDEDSTTRPLLVVTASVDKMELKKPIRVDTDLKIAGAVTYVGRSSIDIQIEVTQVDTGILRSVEG